MAIDSLVGIIDLVCQRRGGQANKIDPAIGADVRGDVDLELLRGSADGAELVDVKGRKSANTCQPMLSCNLCMADHTGWVRATAGEC